MNKKHLGSQAIPTRDRIRTLGIAAVFCATSTAARATTYTLNPNRPSDVWTDPATWTPNGVPTAADNVQIPVAAQLNLGGNQYVNALSLGGDVTLGGGRLGAAAVNVLSTPETAGLTTPVRFDASMTEGKTSGGVAFPLGNFRGSSTRTLIVVQPTAVSTVNAAYVAFESGRVATTLALTGPTTLEGTATLSSGSTGYLGGVLTLDNRQNGSQSDRIGQSVLTVGDGGGGVTLAVGNSAVAEHVATLTVPATTAILQVTGDGSADGQLNVGQLSRADLSVTGFKVQTPGITRITLGAAPDQVGGGAAMTQRPIIPFAFASNGGGPAGPATYDQSPATSGSGVVGARALFANEYSSIDTVDPLANVRVSGAVSLGSARTVNSLTLGGSNLLDLGSSDLTITSGLVIADVPTPQSYTVVRSSGGGALRSGRPMLITPGESTAATLTIDAPIAAPSVTVANGTFQFARPVQAAGGVVVIGQTTLNIADAAPFANTTIHLRPTAQLQAIGNVTINSPIDLQGIQRTVTTTASGTSTSGSVGSLTISASAGNTLTIASPLQGGATVLCSGGGLFRFTGGGSFEGKFSDGPPGGSQVELDGTWTTPAGGSGISASGHIYGNADIPIKAVVGTLSPGAPDSVGAMRILALASSISSVIPSPLTLAFDVDGAAADRLNVQTASQFTSYKPTLSVSLLGTPVFGQTYTVLEQEATSAQPLVFSNTPNGGTLLASNGWSFLVSTTAGDGNDVTITAVPEPMSLAGLVLGASLFARRRTRR